MATHTIHKATHKAEKAGKRSKRVEVRRGPLATDEGQPGYNPGPTAVEQENRALGEQDARAAGVARAQREGRLLGVVNNPKGLKLAQDRATLGLMCAELADDRGAVTESSALDYARQTLLLAAAVDELVDNPVKAPAPEKK